MTIESYDLIVVGAGAGGLATAGRAADLGARVLVLEKTPTIGGSAALSAGILWTAPDLETLHRIQPDADPVLGPLVVQGYQQAVDDVRAAGVAVSAEWTNHLEWGRACKIDIADLFAHWSGAVTAGGGAVLTSVSDVELVRDSVLGQPDSVTGVHFTCDGVRLT